MPIFDATLKCCPGHYHDLRAALNKKGVWHLCTSDTFVREQRAEAWLQGQCPAHMFDPLAVSLLEIRSKLSDILEGGQAVGCPLCNAAKLLDSHGIPPAWIDNITDLMVVAARTNGLPIR